MMFDKARWRFKILQGMLIVAGLALAGRVVQVQAFDHGEHLERAKRTWTDDIAIPPERGNIYDRDLRPLALSISAWRVGVAGSLIEGQEEKIAALLAEVLDRDPGRVLRQIRKAGSDHVVVAARAPLTRDHQARLRAFKAITTEDLRARVYPFDGLAASLVGFYREDPKENVETGLELGLRKYLAGTPGTARLIATGKTGEDLGQVEVQAASHGKSLVLTVDTDLQSICEDRLRESVDRTGAIGGSVLVLDPDNGDILAAASWPLVESRKERHPDSAVWSNRNFTHIYEPGSVFKVFTATSLLKHGAIDTAMVFDCSNGDFGRFTIRNDEGHAYGNLPFMPAFSRSSNIFFARAVANLRDEEFYDDLLEFGFGQGTNLPYPGSSAGILYRPDRWSGRSKPTMAIGQEVAVTPLQLGMAICAVANGGTLYTPRLIREVRNEQGRVVEAMPPRALRQVMSEPLAALLRGAMGRVVTEGTGVAANEEWIHSGGKTGTAQKSRDGRTYAAGAYIASFSGIVPVDDPRLVVLTVLDEPRGVMHYASMSAVPLYRDILRDIRSRTDYLTGLPGGATAPMPLETGQKMQIVPDVLHMPVDRASLHLRRLGLEVEGEDRGGLVVQQVPLPGTRLAEGSTVRLTAGTSGDMAGQESTLCPDFSGLSNRQARGLAARLGLNLNIEGTGYTVAQFPRPGDSLGGGPVKLRMELTW